MAKRKQFTFYWSFYDALADLPPEQAKEGLWIIVTYALTGQMPEVEMEPAIGVAFKLIKPVLDAARKKSNGAMNSQEKQKKQKEEKTLAAQQISDAPKQDGDRITAGCPQDAVKEKEVEIEKENESEVEVEIENEIEKESFTHMGSVPLVCVRDEFDFFWDAYPLKLGKKQAWLVWKKNEPELEQVMSALARWKRSKKWQTEEGRYIPRADRFLEEKYYEQPPKDTVPMGASGYLGQAEVEAIERLMNGK
jgi:hypothetical protein